MSTYRPLSRSATRKKPWLARVTIDGVSFCLGYFATKDEADKEEDEFREFYAIKPAVRPTRCTR